MMQDLAELARQRFLAQYPETNGHVVIEVKEKRHSAAKVNFCSKCSEPFQNGTRHRYRIEHQYQSRKWQFNGVEVFYVCDACYRLINSLLEGGF